MKKLFPEAVWVEECEPGYILASKCREKLAEYRQENDRDANVVFLQNHGVFFAAKTVAGLDEIVADVMNRLDANIKIRPDFTEAETDRTTAAKIAPVLRMLYDPEGCSSPRARRASRF